MKIIALISGKGGVGKTTLTANIGIALAMLGRRTLVIDTDAGLRNLDIALGIQDSIVYDFHDVIKGYCKPKDALMTVNGVNGLSFLAAPQTAMTIPLELSSTLTLYEDDYDYILLDCPGGISHGYEVIADRIIIVATPEFMSARDSDKAAERAEDRGANNINLIINKIDRKLMLSGKMLNIEEIVNIIAVPLIGVVPYERSVVHTNNRGRPAILDKKSRVGMACMNIAMRIDGKKVKILKDI